MAKHVMSRASETDIFPFGGQTEPVPHGGDLAAARRLFPDAAEPFIDLSTGINPHPYRLPRLPAESFARLPGSDAVAALAATAAKAYGAPSPAHVVPAPGTQILLPLVAGLVRPGRAVVFSPTYGEFARAAALAGHNVVEERAFADARGSELVLIGNPNNPDGRLRAKNDLLALADALHPRGGLLVVDEAFMDVGPPGASLAPEVDRGNVIVLRSFGKFFGLAGLRLGFALAAPQVAARISAILGPWAVSGPALAAGTQALADTAWIEQTKTRLAAAAFRLDALLTGTALGIIGGTSLFRLARTPTANELFDHLGRAGILVRAFEDKPQWLRFGLPPGEAAWRRLHIALTAFQRSR
jgi:cobalamin biosynthesis protein CobC